MDFVRAGRSLHWTEPAAGPHLWFILSDVDPDTTQVVVVRLVTSRPYTDKTLSVNVGDHSFIQHESNIDCGSALLLRADKLNEMLNSGEMSLGADMSTRLLEQARNAVLVSSKTIHFVTKYCRTRW